MIKQKILYICPKPLNQKAGGDVVNIRNREILNLTGNEISCFEIPHKKRLSIFISLLNGYCAGISHNTIERLLTKLKNGNYNTVFIWSSKGGKLASIISKRFPNVKIITFFHNIETQYCSAQFRTQPTLKNRFIKFVVEKNEQQAVKYSNSLIVMNKRDDSLLRDHYGINANMILPLGLTDQFNKSIIDGRFEGISKKLKLLFLGSAFFANIEGIRWFLDKVLPQLTNIELTIAGKDMTDYFQSFEDPKRNNNVRVSGYIEDLESLYIDSHIVVSPIYSGGGMKTKTAEAMMYGCPIIGTSEAFEGYNMDFARIGALCNSAEDFITAINRLRISQEELINCSKYSRRVFMERYETHSLVNGLKSLLSELG